MRKRERERERERDALNDGIEAQFPERFTAMATA